MAETTTPKVQTYGWRVARTGEVFAYTERPTRGRCRPSMELFVGNLSRVPGGWRHDAACDTYRTQTDAAQALVRIICG